jgi:hypothetical protein
MIFYLLQHCPHSIVLAKAHYAEVFSTHFNALAAFIQVLIQGRQLSIRDTFAYCQTIALSQYHNKKLTHA